MKENQGYGYHGVHALELRFTSSTYRGSTVPQNTVPELKARKEFDGSGRED
jgi:hypothetical protein